MPDLAASQDAEIVAICRRSEVQLKKMADHFGVERTFTDYKEMIESVEMDAVVIVTPPSLHYEQTVLALEGGLHVLLEKPMTLTSDEAKRLVELSDGMGSVLIVALNPPYGAHTKYVKELIESGELGKIEALELSWMGNVGHVFGKVPAPESLPGVVPPTLYRADSSLSGGGYFIDGASHLVSEVLWTTGLRPVEVYAFMDNPDMDMRSAVSMKMENGSICSILGVGDSEIIDRRVQKSYFGSEGTLEVEGLPFRVTFQKSGSFPVTLEESDMRQVEGPVANFLDVILGKAEPLSPATHGLDVVEVVEAAYRSARTGQAVKLYQK